MPRHQRFIRPFTSVIRVCIREMGFASCLLFIRRHRMQQSSFRALKSMIQDRVLVQLHTVDHVHTRAILLNKEVFFLHPARLHQEAVFSRVKHEWNSC